MVKTHQRQLLSAAETTITHKPSQFVRLLQSLPTSLSPAQLSPCFSPDSRPGHLFPILSHGNQLMGSSTECDSPAREAQDAHGGQYAMQELNSLALSMSPRAAPLPPGTAGRREGVPARSIGSPRGTTRRFSALHWPGCPFPPSRLAERDGIPSGAGRRRSVSGRGRAPAAGAARARRGFGGGGNKEHGG